MLTLHSLGQQIESPPGPVIHKLFTGEELLVWVGTTVGGWACLETSNFNLKQPGGVIVSSAHKPDVLGSNPRSGEDKMGLSS